MTIIYFILLLSLIISIHEAGHLLAAKIFGVYCSEYSIGMGPVLFSHKGKETTYSLRLLPIGGFVAMAGDNENVLESNTTSDIPFERTLLGIAKYKKIIIMLAGIFMNFVLAFVLIACIQLHVGSYRLPAEPILHQVLSGSPAEAAGLHSGDRVISLQIANGKQIKPKDFDEMSVYLLTYEGKGDVNMQIERNQQLMNIRLTPRYVEKENRYLIGVSAPEGVLKEVNWLNCWYYSWLNCVQMLQTIWLTLGQLIRGIGVRNLSGPIGIFQATGKAAAAGPLAYFYVMALISLNIGFMNLLPLPILDGGRVFLTIVEALFRRPLPKKVENALMLASTAAVLALFVYATFNDILRLL